MPWALVLVLALGLAPCVVTLMAGQQGVSVEPLQASMNEVGIRRYVSDPVLPRFPPESLRLGHEGVAVADIRFAPSGVMERVSVLEAPDRWIAASVTEALQRWTIPMKGATPPRMQSKATFYFVIVEGKGVVFPPQSAPLAREWNSRSTIAERLSGRKEAR